MGVPFREMMLTAGRRLQDYLESYKRSKMEARVEDNAESDKTNEQESAWEQLQKVFAEVDERQNLVRQLKVNVWCDTLAVSTRRFGIKMHVVICRGT